MNKKLLFLFFLCIIFSRPAFATEPSPWTTEPTYFEKVTGKLGFGVTNFFKGWVEPYVHMVRSYQDEKSVFTGLARGTAYGFVDVLGGAAHTVSFLIPFDIPLPEGGAHGYKEPPDYSSL